MVPLRSPRWVPESAVRAIHGQLIAEFGGLPGVPRPQFLESALARPRQLLAYGDPPPSVQQLAAAYGFALAHNHCFADGNKRVALAVVDVFLALNGLQLQAPEPAAVEVIRGLAAGEISEAEFARWITANTPGDAQL